MLNDTLIKMIVGQYGTYDPAVVQLFLDAVAQCQDSDTHNYRATAVGVTKGVGDMSVRTVQYSFEHIPSGRVFTRNDI